MRRRAFAALVLREWRTSWADRRADLLRGGYAAALLLGVIVVWVSLPLLFSETSETYPERVRSIVAGFSRVQFVMATLLASITFARAVCREQEQGTMDLLILCPLTRTEILVGKLAGEFLGLTSLIAAGLPVLFLLLPLGGLSALDILTLQTLMLGHMLMVGGFCVGLAALNGRTFAVMGTAWVLVAVLTGGFRVGHWFLPRLAPYWDLWESLSTLSILDDQLSRPLPDPAVSLKLLGFSAIVALLFCGLGSLVLERRHVRGPRIGLIGGLAVRIRRFAASPRGRVLFRPLPLVKNILIRRELSIDRNVGFWILWMVLFCVYAVATLKRPWWDDEHHLKVSVAGLAVASVIAAVEGALAVGYERRRGVLQMLLAVGVSPDNVVRSRFTGVLFRTVALVALPTLHLTWLWFYHPFVPREELPWRAPIAMVGLVFAALALAQNTVRLALGSPRPEVAAAMAAILAIPIAFGVTVLTGLTLGSFALCVPIWIGSLLATHARLTARLPRWLGR